MVFPKLIHVVYEDNGDDTTFLSVEEYGVSGVDESGRKIAVYQKVSEGVVHIEKTFVEKKGKR
jgi:hypothetical protein